MPFRIVRNDITKVSADAIVNTANPNPVIGRGTDSAIYQAAGLEKLFEARKQIGTIEYGKSAWTKSYNLLTNGVKYIIHTVGVSYGGGENGETDILRSCYSTSLKMAKDLGCKSVAIPLLATGFYSFPNEIGLQIAVDEISKFLIENDIDVTLVVYDQKSYLISEKLFDDIQNFIDENFIDEKEDCNLFSNNNFVGAACVSASNSINKIPRHKKNRSEKALQFLMTNSMVGGLVSPVGGDQSKKSKHEIPKLDVDEFIDQSKGVLNFQNTLQHLIADRNLENVAVYTKAFLDRKFFSKIISNKNYVPKKMTVMALGLALELTIDEYESFLASAGYAFMPSSKFDLIVKYCVMNGIYNLVEVDMILDSHGECCFASE